MARQDMPAAAPAKEGPAPTLPVLLADRQGVAFVATARHVESLRVPRRYWGMEVGLVPIPASDEEIRAAELAATGDAGTWPSVVSRPDLLAPALSRLLSGEHAEMSLQPSRDGLRVTLLTAQNDEQSFPIAPKDALGFLSAIFQQAPSGVVRTGQGKPARALLSIRPATRRHEYRVRLAGVVSSSTPVTLSDTGLSPAVLELVLEGLERPSGLLLVAGGPSSGRTTSLALLASTLLARGHKGGLIGVRLRDRKPDLPWLAEALSDWPFPESLHGAAPDFVVVDRIAGSGDLVLAARLAASGSLVLAGVPAAEPEALARTVARDLEGGSGPTVPLAILSQALVRTVCRDCRTWRTIPLAQAERLGFQRRDLEEMGRKGGLVVPQGQGCHDCGGTGCSGLTGVFEYLAPEAGGGSLPRMREDGWRKVWQGIACSDDVAALPGAQRTMRTLREIAVHAGVVLSSLEAAPEASERSGEPPRGSKGPRRPAPLSAAIAGSPGRETERLAGILRAARTSSAIDPAAVRDMARLIASRGEGDLQANVVPGQGFHLARHCVNTALIAVRIAANLGSEIDLQEVALLGLVHDCGLLSTGLDPDAEGQSIAHEEALDPAGARLNPGPFVKSLLPADRLMEGLIRQTHLLLSSEVSPTVGAPRPDVRAQVVALASLIDLYFHGPEAARLSDLHDVTSIVMEQHGRRFGPALFRALLRAIPIFPIGALVELSSGDLARVVSLNEDNHFRPRVEIASAGGESMSDRRVVDLSRAPFLHIRHRVAGAAPDDVGSMAIAGARR